MGTIGFWIFLAGIGVASGIFLLSGWLLRKFEIGKKKYRWIFATLLTLVLAPLTFLGGILMTVLILFRTPDHRFTRERWDRDPEKRYTMARSIVRSKVLVGKTEEEIAELLGECGKYTSLSDSSHRVYMLGTQYGLMTANTYYLEIVMEEGRAVFIETGRDNGSLAYELEQSRESTVP